MAVQVFETQQEAHRTDYPHSPNSDGGKYPNITLLKDGIEGRIENYRKGSFGATIVPVPFTVQEVPNPKTVRGVIGYFQEMVPKRLMNKVLNKVEKDEMFRPLRNDEIHEFDTLFKY